MRLDIPFDPPPDTRRPDHEVSPAVTGDHDSKSVDVPESPLTRRLERLQQRPAQSHVYHVEQPRHERQIEPNRDPIDKRRVKEHRPRRTREGVAVNIRGIRLRPTEETLLSETGRFRVLAVKDIAKTIYFGDERGLRTDIQYLQDHGLIRLDTVAARNDGRLLRPHRIEVVTLTRRGEQLAYETGKFAPEQKLYHGLVKPREVEHDTQIYRAYLKEAKCIESAGGRNPRVELDFELKHEVQKAIYAARKAEPELAMDDIKQRVAGELDLPYVNNKIEIPDARIYYDLDQGSQTAFSDIEVVTAAYRPQHLRSKAQAGFRMYASSSDRASVSARIEDEHHTLDWVFDL